MEEINCPDPNYYMTIGYDKNPGDGVMHYRYVVRTELEDSEYVDKSPFSKYDIRKGYDMVDGEVKTDAVDITGMFKGLVRIT
jgi:hypothetical protein